MYFARMTFERPLREVAKVLLVRTELPTSLASNLSYGVQRPFLPWFCPVQLWPLLPLVCSVERAHQDRLGVPNTSLPHQRAPWPCVQPAASSPPPHLAWFNTCWRGSNTPLVEVNQADIQLVEVTGTEQRAETDTQLSLDSAVRFEHMRTYEFLVENDLKTKPSVRLFDRLSYLCFDLSPLVEVTGREN